MKKKNTKQKILEALEDKKKINIKEAIKICEDDGWVVVKGKYFLEWNEEKMVFQNDKELINYAEELDNLR